MKFIIACFPGIVHKAALAQNGEWRHYCYQTISPTALQEDFSIFRKTTETIYPSLYRYSDSVNITAYLGKQSELLNRPMDETEFLHNHKFSPVPI